MKLLSPDLLSAANCLIGPKLFWHDNYTSHAIVCGFSQLSENFLTRGLFDPELAGARLGVQVLLRAKAWTGFTWKAITMCNSIQYIFDE